MTLAANPNAVPIYLANLPRWLLWRTEQRINRTSGETEATKPPISYHSGKRCDVTDPRNWTDFASVVAALEKSRAWDGFGIALGEIPEHDEILIGLDLDACLNEDDALADWAMPFLTAMGSYTERSPGGAGLKCLARIRRSDLPAIRKLLDLGEGDRDQARTRTFGARGNGGHAPGAQLFLMGRYFTITGRHWPASPEDVYLLALGQIAQLAHLFGPKEQRASAPPGAGQRDDDETEPDEATLRDRLGVEFVRNPRLKERWEGGTQGLSDTSRSGRDMSVLALLVTAGFSKGETRAALRLFQHGKLPDEEQDPKRGDYYFEQMWARTTATPHLNPEPPPGWEEQHPAASGVPGNQQRSRRQRHEPADLSTVWDPWENPPPPQWPPGILPAQIEDSLANLSLRDGVDLGALSMTAITAAAAAAPKDARFAPYNTNWTVPPIIWLMTIGESGSRKTLLEEFGFCVIRAVQMDLWRPHNARMQEWRRLPAKERGPKPEEPHSYLLNDYTPEALQAVLARTTRGTAIVKDELAGFLEFDRYKRSGGSAARAFFLSAFEDKDCPVHRIGRDSEVVEHTGLTVFGNIQPRRLATFQADMEADGLLQRFVPLWIEAAQTSRPKNHIGPGLATLYDTIRQLCHLTGRRYTTTDEAAQLILDTETIASEYATLTDFGLGWPGFCHKLHGTHARLALILHLMEAPEADLVPFDTVRRASRLVHHFILQHAHDFYAALPGRGRNLTHDIAGWLLTRGPANAEPERILASDVTAGVKACRPLGSKAVSEALDPFVTGGWLVPENDYPTNRAWFFNPAIRYLFTDQTQLAREQRTEARALIARIQAPRPQSATADS
jgi:hypothetical protein